MANKMPPVIYDSAEQKPWELGPDFYMVRGKLRTGDYTFQGLEDVLTIERKSIGDLVGTVIQDWIRFRKQLVRMSGFDLACVVVEGTPQDILDHKYESQANPESVIGKCNAIYVDHGIPVFWYGPRPVAVHMVERLLVMAWKRYGREVGGE